MSNLLRIVEVWSGFHHVLGKLVLEGEKTPTRGPSAGCRPVGAEVGPIFGRRERGTHCPPRFLLIFSKPLANSQSDSWTTGAMIDSKFLTGPS